MDVQIYSKPDCGYCLNAKNWFKEHGIDYIEHSLINEDDQMEFIQRVNNVEEKLGNKMDKLTSVPQIFVNEVHIGGFQELEDYFFGEELIFKPDLKLVEDTKPPKIGALSGEKKIISFAEKRALVKGRKLLEDKDE